MSDVMTAITPNVYDYLLNVSLREPAVLKKLREQTHKMSTGHMQISPEQGQFMSLLVELIDARKTLDIGVFTGYSALAVAMALPSTGTVVGCDINGEWTKIARRFWEEAGVNHKIDLCLAPAKETLQALIDEGEVNSFDFAFIDADKASYPIYYEQCMLLVRQGGLIAIDNVLYGGHVADSSVHDTNTKVIRELNEKILHDDRVTISMLPVGDGLTLARKR
jgi:predicted O-methyltransferase YrrM